MLATGNWQVAFRRWPLATQVAMTRDALTKRRASLFFQSPTMLHAELSVFWLIAGCHAIWVQIPPALPDPDQTCILWLAMQQQQQQQQQGQQEQQRQQQQQQRRKFKKALVSGDHRKFKKALVSGGHYELTRKLSTKSATFKRSLRSGHIELKEL